MQKNAKTTFWILVLCVGCFFVAWNVRLIFLKPLGVVLALSPERIEVQTSFVEGSKFQAEFVLENKAPSNLLIRRIASSCGCTGLFAKDAETIEFPMVLAPHEPFPISVTVDTHGMEGKRSVSLMVLYEYRGRSLFSDSDIVFDVIRQETVDMQE